MTPYAIGIDFGTTNSTVAVADATGGVRSVSWPSAGGPTDIFRTALMFWSEGRPPRAVLRHVGGPAALDRALYSDGSQRFIQSIKTYLASAAFSETRLFATRFTIEQLVATFLGHLIDEDVLRGIPTTVPVVAGRPVVFAGSRPDEALAVGRLASAYKLAGLPQAALAFEPLGAAYWYARNLRVDQTVLVADFGGGTSDFSVIRFTRDGAGRLEGTPLAHAGVGVAGDTFDYRLVDHLVAPRLGKGSHYRSFEKRLPFPAYVHAAFAQWHQLSWLRTPKIMAELRGLAAASDARDKIEALITFLDMDLAFDLYRAISALKSDLSRHDRATLDFSSRGVTLKASVTRADFERFIADDLARIGAATDLALDRAGLAATDVEAVFMTGGTSAVPAVRSLFADRFGSDRLHFGHPFQSVASGLALLAADRLRRQAAGSEPTHSQSSPAGL